MIHDRILQTYISDFAKEHDLLSLPADTLFEHFVNVTIVSKIFGQSIDSADVSTGKAHGIDGIAILVNDQLVLSPDELMDLSRSRLDAHFVFIQSKSSNTFDLGEMLKFSGAVEDFFSDDLPPAGDGLGRFRETKQQIYRASIKMETAPLCELYYVSCGKWANDALLSSKIDQIKESLKSTGLFRDVRLTPVDAEKLKSYYRALKQQVVQQVTFEKYAVIPKMGDVDQAYIGVLPAKEYLKLITDEDGNLQRNLFYDNVRDFQGDNAVNMEINETIRGSLARQDKFAILNNGITIVAQEIRPIGTEFTLRDYQVVNGCQTSHVLFLNRGFLSDTLYVPIKLVATSSQDVANLVIKATNRQTEIKEEAFAALEPFHKRLEEFYASFTDPASRLFYERRSRQYDRDNVARSRIVSIPVQTKAYVAMLSGEPHNAHHYYGELLKIYWQSKKSMYQDDHDPWPYFASALSYVEVDKLLRVPSRISQRPFKNQLLGLIANKFFGKEPRDIFKLGSRKIAPKCQDVVDFWMKKKEASAEVDRILDFIDSTYRKKWKNEAAWKVAQRRDFTEALFGPDSRNLFDLEKGPTQPDRPSSMQGFAGLRVRGTIKRIGPEFGFIEDERGHDVFFHRSSIIPSEVTLPGRGLDVEFTPVLAPRGPKAVDIVITRRGQPR